jgi:hypothetical protein
MFRLSRREAKRTFRRGRSDKGAAHEIVNDGADDGVGGDSFEQRRSPQPAALVLSKESEDPVPFCMVGPERERVVVLRTGIDAARDGHFSFSELDIEAYPDFDRRRARDVPALGGRVLPKLMEGNIWVRATMPLTVLVK